ncbi:MAG TPA: protein kinase [Candidatus Obscuribacterales bacterium]
MNQEENDNLTLKVARTEEIWACTSCGTEIPKAIDSCPNDGTKQTVPFEAGDPIVGPYTYISTLGAGGMGIVYKAKHTLLDKVVAIKMLQSDGLTGQALARFQREARVTSKLRHPNIITVHDLGATERGQPYLVMDFLEGVTLDRYIAKEGGLPVERMIFIMHQICDALELAHKNGIVHRDLKPANVMLTETDSGAVHVHLLDFGIAKMLGMDANSDSKLTKTGNIFGTPAYMSPEQCRGQPVDARSDIYSLGCMMYEMLTGVTPHVANSAVDMMVKHLSEQPPTLKEASFGRQFSPALERIVSQALKKDPNERYQTISELKSSLLSIEEDSVAQDQKSQDPQRTIKEHLSKPLTIGVLSAILLVSIVAWSWTASKQQAVTETKSSSETSAIPSSDTSATPSDDTSTSQSQQSIRNIPRVSPLPPLNESDDNPELDRWVRDHMASREFNAQKFQLYGIDDAGVEVLNRLNNLHVLRLRKTKVKGDGLKHLKNTPIVILDVAKTHIADEALPIIARIHTIQFLDLSETDVTDRGLPSLSPLELHALWINNVRITDRAMKSITAHPKLAVLHINGNKIGDAGIAYLSRLKYLWELHVERTPITDKSLKEIGKIEGMKILDLQETGITSRGLVHLENLRFLKELDLRGCSNVDQDAVLRLQKALPHCRILY